MAFWQLENDKANAMRRFQRKRTLETIFHLFKLCAAILLFSHCSSFFPNITLQTFPYLYHFLLPLFRNSFYAFLLLNAIILLLFTLSNNVGASKDALNQSRLIVTASQDQLSRTVDSSDKKITTTNFDPSSSPVFEETVRAVTETTTTTTCCCTTVTTTEGETVSVSEKKCYRRVQSESYERRMAVAPPSEDEFNRAVEEFIAMNKRMQKEEHIRSQKTGYWASN
ncbi:hypothetical protein glysoja_023092 [Glycine soja]|nr:hypothetical protein glysoja_023092 [Glycine soja]